MHPKGKTVTERTMIVSITRKADHRTVTFAFDGNEAENFTFAGDVTSADDEEKFEQLGAIIPGLHALDDNANREWKAQKPDEGQTGSATASDQFAVPDAAMQGLCRFRRFHRLRYTDPQ